MGMDVGAKKILETVTVETLHAHHFSRASTQATLVLTDLLARYLTVLSSTCAQYAEHAGRLRITPQDAFNALGELGLGVDELREYCATEAREMSRYAVHTRGRAEDLNDFKAALSVGLREDRDDAIPLVYAPVPDDVLDYEEQDDSEEEESEPEVEVEETVKRKLDTTDQTTELDIPSADDFAQIFAEKRGERVASPRPLTPESNPPSPRKRPRTASWSPPEYVPDFLPPFPNHTPRQTPSPPLVSQPLPALDAPPIPVKIERPLTPPPELLQTVADYRTPVPYNMSLRASRGLSQLPVRPVTPPSKPPPQFKLPEVQPSLYQAYHHALTHPPPKELGPTNPARYRVAVTLIEQAQANPRWEPVPSLFAISAPNQPRVSSIGPVHPVPIADPVQEKNGKGKEAEVEPKWPVVGQRHIFAAERVAPLVSQQGSRLPNLARQVLAHNVISRTTRLYHPLALTQDNKKLTYGPGISAPWNTGTAAAAATTPTLPNGAKKEKEKDAPPKALPDARLYATWNWERKSFREPLPRRPSRMGTVQLSGTIGNGRRARSESHS